MRSLSTLLILCIISLLSSLSAQEPADINELLNRLSQNHMGSINEVFTLNEIAVLRAHIDKQIGAAAPINSAVVRRGESTKGNVPIAVTQIDPVSLGVMNLGPSPLSEFEGAGITITNENRSYIADNNNRIFIRGVGSTEYVDTNVNVNVLPAQVLTGIEVLSNGDVYAIGTNGVDNSTLYQLDKFSWQASPVGGNNGLVLPINLARDASDNLITVDIDNDTAYRINPITGAPVALGPIGFDANFGQGMAYDDDLGAVLMAAFNNTTFDTELRTLNTDTGLTISLGTITPGTTDQFGWVSWYNTINLETPDVVFDTFEFHPNPVSDVLNLSSQTNVDRISILDISGKVVMDLEVGALTASVDISDLTTGLYLLNVEISGQNASYKFIKR